jgi:hypothetical protein
VPTVQAIGYEAGALNWVAVVEHNGAPVTPEVPRFSPFLNPEKETVNVGTGSEYCLPLLSAVTVSIALPIVSEPFTYPIA